MNIKYLGEGLKYTYFCGKVFWFEHWDPVLFSENIPGTDVKIQRHNTVDTTIL